jgi:hypothetical protein
MAGQGTTDPFGFLVGKTRKARKDREVTESLRRRIQATLFNDVVDTSLEYNTPEPGGFLAQLVAGYDPRPGRSGIGLILDNVRARGAGAMPTQGEWEALADMLDRSPCVRGEYVDLETSRKAAEKLLPFIYATTKERAPVDEGAADIAINHPLTQDEIAEFQEFWNDEY